MSVIYVLSLRWHILTEKSCRCHKPMCPHICCVINIIYFWRKGDTCKTKLPHTNHTVWIDMSFCIERWWVYEDLRCLLKQTFLLFTTTVRVQETFYDLLWWLPFFCQIWTCIWMNRSRDENCSGYLPISVLKRLFFSLFCRRSLELRGLNSSKWI